MKIILLKNGPILISNEQSKVALCRCGLSQGKPLCDGNHKYCDSILPEGAVNLGEFISVGVKE